MPHPRAAALILASLLLMVSSACGADVVSRPSGPTSTPVGGFASDLDANRLAGEAAGRFRAAVGDDPSFVDLGIDDDGVVVEVTGTPSARVTAALPDASATVPFRVRSVPNAMATLRSISARLDADAAQLRGEGVAMSSWGPDFASNRVRITLEIYTAAAARSLVAAYGGPDLVEVATQPLTVVGSAGESGVPAPSPPVRPR